MKQVLINYVVKEGKVDENTERIRAVFQQLREQQLQGVKYAAYKMGENVFVHIARFESAVADKNFSNLRAFLEFRAGIEHRLEEKPIVNVVHEIDSYDSMK